MLRPFIVKVPVLGVHFPLHAFHVINIWLHKIRIYLYFYFYNLLIHEHVIHFTF